MSSWPTAPSPSFVSGPGLDLEDRRVVRPLNQLDSVEAVLLVEVAFARVGDHAVIGRHELPAPVPLAILVDVETHGLLS